MELKTNEIIKIIKDNDLKYFSIISDNHYNTIYFLRLHDKNKNIYKFKDDNFKINIKENQIKELFKLFNIKDKLMTCIYYKCF